MLVAICHCQKENAQAKQLAAWMAELGGPCPNHRLLVGRDERAEPNLFANSGFSGVEEITIIGDAWNKWPESCNNAFRQIAKYIEYTSKEPWLWLECDAVPLKKEWLDRIEAEYKEALARNKVFLGDFVHINEPGFLDHMSGVAVYPGLMSNHAGDAMLAHENAWDVAAASQILPQMHKSKLILHRWKLPPFESWEQVEQRIFAVKLNCVLFHQDKSQSLLPLLREGRKEGDALCGTTKPSKEWEESKESASSAAPSVQPAFGAAESFSSGTSIIAKMNGDSRESLVRDAVAVLKQLCTAPRYISQVRKELKAQGVIK